MLCALQQQGARQRREASRALVRASCGSGSAARGWALSLSACAQSHQSEEKQGVNEATMSQESAPGQCQAKTQSGPTLRSRIATTSSRSRCCTRSPCAVRGWGDIVLLAARKAHGQAGAWWPSSRTRNTRAHAVNGIKAAQGPFQTSRTGAGGRAAAGRGKSCAFVATWPAACPHCREESHCGPWARSKIPLNPGSLQGSWPQVVAGGQREANRGEGAGATVPLFWGRPS